MKIQTILVVDDSPTERHVIGSLLKEHGYHVLMANDGNEAIAISKKKHPDLILMDVVMPASNGFQATRALSKDKDTQHIPIILCTSKNQETDKIWGMRQGAHDYLTKPINPSLLLSRIKLFNE